MSAMHLATMLLQYLGKHGEEMQPFLTLSHAMSIDLQIRGCRSTGQGQGLRMHSVL